jgi:thioredoxin 1
MGDVPEVSAEDFETRVLRATGPVVVDFYADRCAPCRRMAPVIERLAAELDGRVGFVKLDVDRSPDVAAAFRVSSIPTLLRFEDGRPVARSVGARPGRLVSRQLGLPLGRTDPPAREGPRSRLFRRRAT